MQIIPSAVHRFGLVDLEPAGGDDGQVVDGQLLVGVDNSLSSSKSPGR
ncbi:MULTISPECIES: hypothetical protein [Streptomyces]|nr:MULTISPECIES: hypothetical protein [Streptomyces]